METEEMKSREISAKTIEEAIEIATLELGVDRAEVEVEVLNSGRAGILGIGAEQARVKVTRIETGDGEASAAMRILSHLLRSMEAEAQVTIRSSGSGPDDPPILDIQGMDAGLLIGRRGETLQAIQFIVNLLVSRQMESRTIVVVDVEQYRERRHRNLRALALRTADRVAASGRAITLEPMTAADRRIIHISLTDHDKVITESSGEGAERKISIRPASGG